MNKGTCSSKDDKVTNSTIINRGIVKQFIYVEDKYTNDFIMREILYKNCGKSVLKLYYMDDEGKSCGLACSNEEKNTVILDKQINCILKNTTTYSLKANI